MEANYNTMRKVTVAGSSLSVAGSVAAILGLALSPATIGASLTLSVIGGVVAASGGAATVGASVDMEVNETIHTLNVGREQPLFK